MGSIYLSIMYASSFTQPQPPINPSGWLVENAAYETVSLMVTSQTRVAGLALVPVLKFQPIDVVVCMNGEAAAPLRFFGKAGRQQEPPFCKGTCIHVM